MNRPFDTQSQTWRATPDLIAIVDDKGVFRASNPAWMSTLGLSPEEVNDHHFSDFLHDDDLAPTLAVFEQMQGGVKPLNFKNRYRHKDGHWVWLSWNAVPEGDDFFCLARDVSSEVENEARLKTREQEAKLREQVLAMLGHDLRNPLAAITAALRMALKEDQTDRGRHVLTLASDAARRMNGLIHDISDFTRIRLGDGIELQERSSDIGEIIADAVSEARLLHPSALIVTDLELVSRIRCDSDRIQQLLGHLLDNAIRHGRTAHPIRVIARQSEDASTIAVENDGEAIPPSVLPLLFRPFFRHETSSAGAGLGLGLHISREIAQAHGGTLSVTSTEDATVFTLTLPHRP